MTASCSRVHFQLHGLKVRYCIWDDRIKSDYCICGRQAPVPSWFWRMGGVIVGTSNKVPEDLYQNGVQKESLEPFVEALKEQCPIVLIQLEQNWRMVRGDGQNRTWFKRDQEEQFNTQPKLTTCGDTGALSARRTGTRISDHAEPQAHKIYIFGRPLHIPWPMGGTYVLPNLRRGMCLKFTGKVLHLIRMSSLWVLQITL